MSGDLLLERVNDPLLPHHRLLLEFQSGRRLAFHDPRKFGRVWLTDHPEMVLGSLGPEPLDEQFSADDLYQRLRQKHRQLKPLLLDQTFLAGVGNIYADEALFLARLHPLSFSNSLSKVQATALWSSIRQVLQRGDREERRQHRLGLPRGGFPELFPGVPAYCRSPVTVAALRSSGWSSVRRGTHFCPVLPAAGCRYITSLIVALLNFLK